MTDGLLIVDKPAGITSHDVVYRVRRALKTKRVGHTGTLDPFATGVMVILVGQATRLAQFLDKDEKEYEAVVQFGSETDTGDNTGQRTAECGLPGDELAARVDEIDWEGTLAGFRGELMQVPPMYSAKKVEGKKLYELARKGEHVERKAVPVSVHELELLDLPAPEAAALVRVVCSAGTYIRTLAEDIGRAVKLGAHLTALRRTRAGRFDISRALTLDELDSAERVPLISMNDAVGHLPAFTLNAERIARTRNGLSSRTEDSFPDGQNVWMLDEAGALVAIGRYVAPEKVIQPKLVFG